MADLTVSKKEGSFRRRNCSQSCCNLVNRRQNRVIDLNDPSYTDAGAPVVDPCTRCARGNVFQEYFSVHRMKFHSGGDIAGEVELAKGDFLNKGVIIGVG